MKFRKQRKKKLQDIDYNINDMASMNEFTGIVPMGITNDEEDALQKDLHINIHTPNIDN